MERKAVSGIMLTLVLLSVSTLAFNIQSVGAEPTTWTVDDDGPADFHTIQEAINAANPGDTIYVSSGIYLENLFIGKTVSLIGENRENTIIDGNHAGTVAYVSADNVKITGFTIRNSELGEFSPFSGIYTYYANGFNISYNTIADNDCSLWLDWSTNGTVLGNNISSNYYRGIYLSGSSSNTVSGNDITNSSDCGVYLWSSSSNTIFRNKITNNTLEGICLGYSSDNSISENNITNNLYGIWIIGSSNNVLKDNVMAGNKYNFEVWGEELSHFLNYVDSSNTVDGKHIVYLINEQNHLINPQTYPNIGHLAVINSTNIIVQDLKIENNVHGVLLAYTTNSSIRNVTVTSNNNGIVLRHSSNNSVSGNNITNNAGGIWLPWSSNNTVSGNIITNNDFGIGLYESSDNTIPGNTITNNRGHGIWLAYSSSNSISENNITNNDYGIDLWESSSNSIFHNNFATNKRNHVYTLNSVNVWDDGYPSGGNYWSEHVTVDDCCGINQDEPGSDGIVDESYVIDDYNCDHYPLVEPWSPVVSATVNIDPDTLNLRSRGKWITGYIQLPEGYNAEDIDATSILLNGTISPVLDPMYEFVTNASEYIVDHDENGILERMVKFDRAEVMALLSVGEATLTITGEVNGTPFEGSDSIRLVFPSIRCGCRGSKR